MGESYTLARLAAVLAIFLIALAVLLAARHYTMQQIARIEEQINTTIAQALQNNTNTPHQLYKFFIDTYTQSLSYLKKIVNIVFNGLLAALIISTIVLGAEALAARRC